MSIAHPHDSGALLAGDRMEYRLGELIAEGGEGRVYCLQDRLDVVAKLYKEFDYTREEKLRHLIGMGNKPLRRVAAWPLSTLQDPEANTVGFVMESLRTWEPLFAIYQIRTRIQNHPHRTFAFLVRTARNLATCVHHLHDAGVIVGDLNESNVLVDPQAMVKLIDADSFQVKIDGRLHECKVGKGELTPPELQGISLEHFERTENHDRFALAVLIFQVLVFGRHPFAGKPIDDREISIEQAIRSGWYPFTKRRSVPLEPPPLTSIDNLPPALLELFERAFDPAEPERPTAREWYHALRDLEGSLSSCRDNTSHRYWSGCTTCPWCLQEEQHNVSLFRPTLVGPHGDFDATGLVKELPERRDLLSTLVMPIRSYEELEPAKLTLLQRLSLTDMTLIVVFVGVQCFLAATSFMRKGYFEDLGFLTALLCAAALMTPGSIRRQFLRRRVKNAQVALDALNELYDQQAAGGLYQRRVQELRDEAEKLSNFRQRYEEAVRFRLRERYQDHLRAYLRKYSVLAADAGPTGTNLLSRIHDRGVKTAEDITLENLDRLFTSDSTTRSNLLHWRQSLELQFWSTSSFALPARDEQEILIRLRREDRLIRERLQNAESELEELAVTLQVRHEDLLETARPHLQVLMKDGPVLRALGDSLQDLQRPQA